jgi:hypothetical protein
MEIIDVREALKTFLAQSEELDSLEITINSKALKNEEAIGHPDRDDFPLLRGKEVLLQAEVGGSLGQAFTSDPISYHGSIKKLLELPAERPGNHALMIATLNAVGNKLGLVKQTIHCLNNEPEECAKKISQTILERHGLCNIGIIGYQPSLIESCVQVFGADHVNVTDLNKDVVGTIRYGIKVLDGLTDTKKLVESADILLITGSILANGTAGSVLDEVGDKKCCFFGTTCAATAYVNKLDRLCPMSK